MKKENYKQILKYVIMYLLFFLCLQFFYSNFQGDQVYNFGFSYAISKGEIPYKDFNMIITPLSAYLYSIPALIFGNHIIVFNLFQALLLCIMFYFLVKIYDKKAWILFIFLFFTIPIPFPTIMFQGYNFLLLLGLIILLFCEKNKANDYLIGLIIGLMFLTKQTVGFTLALPSFYYLFKNGDYKKVLKRAFSFFIVIFFFVTYLLFTNSFDQFIDLCFLGMFDFTSKNGFIFDINFIIFLIEMIFIIYYIVKDKNNIDNYYVLAFSMIAIPLFDYYHVAIFTYAFLFLLMDKIKFNGYKNFEFCSFLFTYAIAIIWFMFMRGFTIPNFTFFKGFEFRLMSSETKKSVMDINDFIKNNGEKNIIILTANAYFFKIVNDCDITYYDLLNYGNHGYDGTNKIIHKIKEEKDPVFIININEYKDNSSNRQQINKIIIKYVLDNYKLMETRGEYVIYGTGEK